MAGYVISEKFNPLRGYGPIEFLPAGFTGG